MCTGIVNVIYIGVLVVATVCTLISLVTPEWKKLDLDEKTAADLVAESTGVKDPTSIKDLSSAKLNTGILYNACGGTKGSCEEYWNDQPTWKKAAIACMVLALLCEGVALIWSIVVCCACCCKTCLIPPLIICSAAATILLIIAITLFGTKSGEEFDIKDIPVDKEKLDSNTTFGYSMWLGIGGIVFNAVDVIVGICLFKTASVSPM